MKTIQIISLFLGLFLFAGCEETKKQQMFISKEMENPTKIQDSIKTKYRTDPEVVWQHEATDIDRKFNQFLKGIDCFDNEFEFTDTGEHYVLNAKEFTYRGIDCLIYNDSVGIFQGLFLGSYIKEINQIHLNYNEIDYGFWSNMRIISEARLPVEKYSQAFSQFVIAIIEQEFWHISNGYENDVEFYSDIVSLKISNEFYLVGRLRDLIGFRNPKGRYSVDITYLTSDDRYQFQFDLYESLLNELGLSSDELVMSSLELGDPRGASNKAISILKNHPDLLTNLKNLILERYG